MIVSRTIFYAKWGRVDELKAMMTGMFQGDLPEGVHGARILSDLDGRFFRLIAEVEFDDLAAWERWRSQDLEPGGNDHTDPMRELVEWGEQEFYTLEATF